MIKPENTLLTPGEVARMLRVNPKTVTRWAASDRIRSVKTPGGHRRFWLSDIQEMLNAAEKPE